MIRAARLALTSYLCELLCTAVERLLAKHNFPDGPQA